jgi:hypothetical protein
MKRIFTILFLFLFAKINAQIFKAGINSLSFMSGKWFQKHEWGDMEEFWGKPMGNCMVSSYRCVKDNKVVFYEFVVIEQSDSVPVMKLRHFNAGSIGWEEKDKPSEYPLVKLEKNKATFAAMDKTLFLSYERVSENKMDIVLREKNKKGEWENTEFHYVLNKE